MNSDQTPAPKMGRPKGSNSFTKVKLSDLIALVGENAVVPVSKVWLRDNGVTEQPAPLVVIAPAVEAPPVEEKIAFTITDFSDGEEVYSAQDEESEQKELDSPVE